MLEMPVAKLHYKTSLIIKYSTEYVCDNEPREGIFFPVFCQLSAWI